MGCDARAFSSQSVSLSGMRVLAGLGTPRAAPLPSP